MAKSSSFFGLRRGSTKSLTFQVNQGKQITKDRVQVVSNPRTEKQMYQRAIMATVMAAYSEMKSICDHSFEGKVGKARNQQEFMRLNLNHLRNAIAGGSYDAVVVAPKTPEVLPNEWVISRGSYPSQKIFAITNNGVVLPAILPLVSATPTYNEIASVLGVSPGTQITFCFINQESGILAYEYPDGDDGSKYPHMEFLYGRVVFKKSWTDGTITPTGADQDEKTADVYKKFFTATLDQSESLPGAYLELTDMEDATFSEDHNPVFNTEVLLSQAGFDESVTNAYGIITSEVDGPGRDNAHMNRIDYDYGIQNNWLLDVWSYGTQLGSSEKYLEGGK